MRILVVEDEADLNLLLCKVLTKAGYTVDGCLDGEDAQAHLLGAAYDGILLDVMLPKKDGYTLVQELRDQGNDTPVLFLTARDSVADRVKGLDLGGDDYLVKPFDFAELLARIRAMTRKRVGQRTNRFTVGDLTLDTVRRQAVGAERRFPCCPRSFPFWSIWSGTRKKSSPGSRLRTRFGTMTTLAAPTTWMSTSAACGKRSTGGGRKN